MLQSCETLITKINEWQKAVLELEGLSDEFLNSGDIKLKPEIDSVRQGIKNLAEEYHKLAYPELPNSQILFWPEKEVLEEILGNLNLDLEQFIRENRFKIKDNCLEEIRFAFIDLSHLPKLNLFLFQSLKKFHGWFCDLKKLPKFNRSIQEIRVNNNLDIEMPDDLSELENLEVFNVWNCSWETLPILNTSIKEINAVDNSIPVGEQERIKGEYPNAKIEF